MPVRRKRHQRRQQDPIDEMRVALDAGQPWDRPVSDLDIDFRLYTLLTGHDHFGLGFGGDEEELEAWLELGAAITEEHARRFPGTRPWAWWHFDAPECRRLMAPEDDSLFESGLWFGAPAARGASRYEDQGHYLERLGLLRPLEKATFAADGIEQDDPVTTYARAVVSGEIKTGKYVQWMVQRHLSDLESVGESGFYLDRRLVDRRLAFNGFLRHHDGRFAGKIFVLEPWQQFVHGSVFGWVMANRLRRFRHYWLEVARKNGKSPMLSGDCAYMLTADGEQGAQVFVAATKKDQAAITFRYLTEMRQRSPLLSDLTRPNRGKILADHVSGFAVPLGADSGTEDGHNVYFGALDEMHAHKTDGMMRVIGSATGAREQPLIGMTTTAGFDPESFGGLEHDHYVEVLDSSVAIDEPRTFVGIWTLDDAEEANEPECWIKANPNLGVSVFLEGLEAEHQKATSNPSGWNEFLVKRMNIWTTATESWLPMDKWSRCSTAEGDPVAWRVRMLRELRGQPCYAGFDLSHKLDLTALVLEFSELRPRVIIPWFWLPEARVTPDRKDRVPYDLWRDQGFIETTPGDTIDYDFILKTMIGGTSPTGELVIEGLAQQFKVQEVAYDPTFAQDLAQRLQDEGSLTVIPCRQGFTTLSAPSMDFEASVVAGDIDHGSNPVLTWNARNVAIRTNAMGYIMPARKRNQRKKIDGISACIFTRWRSMIKQPGSAYEEHGLRVL